MVNTLVDGHVMYERLQFGPLLVRGKYVALLVMKVAHPCSRSYHSMNKPLHVNLYFQEVGPRYIIVNGLGMSLSLVPSPSLFSCLTN